MILGVLFILVGWFVLRAASWAIWTAMGLAVVNGVLNFCGFRRSHSGQSCSLQSTYLSFGRWPPPAKRQRRDHDSWR